MIRVVRAGGFASWSRRARVEPGVAILGPGPGRIRGGRARRIAGGLVVWVAVTATSGSVASAAHAAIYWANISSNTIANADNDGTHVNQSLITDANGPSDLAVYGKHIYWTNATGCTESGSCPGTIGEANLDGTDVNNNLIHSANSPVGVAVTAGSASVPVTAGKGTITITGPTSNVFHTRFNETVSGSASGAANYVISGEQLHPSGGCASTYEVEADRSDWYQWPTGTGPVSGKFKMVAKFYASNHGMHGICSYLINMTTKQTFAHGSRFWDNS